MNIYVHKGETTQNEAFHIRAENKREALKAYNNERVRNGFMPIDLDKAKTEMQCLKVNVPMNNCEKLIKHMNKLPFCFTDLYPENKEKNSWVMDYFNKKATGD